MTNSSGERLLYVTKQIGDRVEIVEGPLPESEARWHATQLVGREDGAVIGLRGIRDDEIVVWP